MDVPEHEVDTTRAILKACAARDAASLEPWLSPSVSWLHYGQPVTADFAAADGKGAAAGERAAETIVADLERRDSRLELKDLARLRPGLVVALLEGTEALPGGSVHGGSRLRSYELDAGKLVRSDVFAFRKDVLGHYGLSTGDAHGRLIVGSDDDERLFHLPGPAAHYEWRSYVARPDWDHDHCGICWQTFAADSVAGHATEGYASAGDPADEWLCPECLDEIRGHFGIELTGGPLDISR